MLHPPKSMSTAYTHNVLYRGSDLLLSNSINTLSPARAIYSLPQDKRMVVVYIKGGTNTTIVQAIITEQLYREYHIIMHASTCMHVSQQHAGWDLCSKTSTGIVDICGTVKHDGIGVNRNFKWTIIHVPQFLSRQLFYSSA